jgi:hypothetical protein
MKQMPTVDARPEVAALLAAVRRHLPELRRLLEQYSDHWHYEDPLYRLYHQSFKVYRLQSSTDEIVTALRALGPGRPLNGWFEEIIRDGTGKTFEQTHNREWTRHTRPIVEAFLHARFFLEMAVRYGAELVEPPALMPSGWAALLYLYDLR